MNETYLRRITSYSDEDLAYIRPIKSAGTLARTAGATGGFDSSWYAREFEAMWQAEPSNHNTNPRICLCSGHVIALVPAMTRVGDVIVRFWGCGTAAVMRPANASGPVIWPGSLAPYFLVGKADISQPLGPWEEPVLYRAKARGFRFSPEGPYTSSVLDVDLDFRSLQMLSAPMGPDR